MDTSSPDEHIDSGYRFIKYFPHLRTRWCGVLDGLGVYMSFYRKGLMQQEMEKNKNDCNDQTGAFY